LSERYAGVVTFDLPQDMVKKVKNSIESRRYDAFIKLDVSNFYPTIRHQELLSRLRRKIRDPNIIEFIKSAIQTPTVVKSSSFDNISSVGVPQGLSISNVLAAIYLINIDRHFGSIGSIEYYRYVDDILIMCDQHAAEGVAKSIIGKFNRLGLKIHDPVVAPDKSKIGRVGEKFDYLGYEFKGSLVSAREGSVEKLKLSLVSIFTGYKHSRIKSKEFLLWRLNLRITGCIFQGKSKGWLFFFSEISNESLLHRLDNYIEELVDRFGVEIRPKKFVRAFFQIKYCKYETKYVPNFDSYNIDQMRHVLTVYFNKSVSKLTDEEIAYEFKRRIDKQVKDLLTDVQGFGS
jgi:RNA-directed DNA polymerase